MDKYSHLEDSEFVRELRAWAQTPEKPHSVPQPPLKPKKHVQLTADQKRFIVNYLLCFSKGIVEDNDFWGDIDQQEIDDYYDAYRDAIDEFIEQAKEALLGMI